MTTDVHALVVKIDTADTRRASSDLDRLQSSGNRAERATDGLTAAFRRAVGPIAAMVSASAALNKLVDVQRQFDVLSAGLVTATGSAEKASEAFQALTDFATTTPYSLEQSVEGFTKLVNMGLTPSEAALRSYGNTASAMGKDLSQMIEAVADATTGEFERLREFGIKAKQEGDRVTFTFQGVKTSIGNNAAEIERFLMAIGENEFASAAANRMATLDGAISNLGDSWDALFRNISEQGVGDIIEDGVRLAIEALDELNAMLASGEMQQYLLAIGSVWGDLGDDARRSMAITADFVSDLFRKTGGDGKTFAGIVFETLSVMGVNTIYVLRGVGTELGGIAAQLAALARGDFGAFAEIGRQMKADAEAARKEVDELTASILNPQPGGAATSEFQRHMEEARRLREEWDKTREARLSAGQDRLAGFRVGGEGSRASDAIDRATASAEKRRREDFQRLVESLRTEEEAIAASYEKRKAIIEGGTTAGSPERSDLMSRLDADRAEQLARLEESRGAELESLRQSLLTEEESIRESYDRRLAIIQSNLDAQSIQRAEMEERLASERDTALQALDTQRASERDSLYNGLLSEEEMLALSFVRRYEAIMANTELTELDRQDLLRRLQEQFRAEQEAAENKSVQTQLNNAQALFGGLAGLAKAYGGEQSKAYRALFAVSKAFSVADATLSIATGLAKAQKLGFPANLAEMARVAATGASIMAQINGTNFSGAYDEGGRIPAGKIGLVGEYGPEFVRGPANVTSRRDTSRMIENAGQQAPQPAPVVNNRIINAVDPSVTLGHLGSEEAENVIMNIIKANGSTIRFIAGGGG